MMKDETAASIEKRNQKAKRLYVKEMYAMKASTVVDKLIKLNDSERLEDKRAREVVNRIKF